MTPLNKIDILLLRYATGSLGASETIVVVILLGISPAARHRVEEFEALGGQIIEHEAPAPLQPESLRIVLERIKAPRRPETPLERLFRLLSGY